ncbi:uncharacterized protein N7473_012711 [Penicillium subrubescens]|uniref:uncharacterized protein n=1 Tax=Penicillium subrubescens TaxID=1316194 RepID=UPI00254503EF|nr:uncharacterized protein N7473_012711 [Penicillium subrubescens]KAJ5875364.1 hypothetical protein N7473_012711 [Penicillium subrubescens]
MHLSAYLSFALCSTTLAVVFKTPLDVTSGETFTLTWTVEDGDPSFINVAIQNDENHTYDVPAVHVRTADEETSVYVRPFRPGPGYYITALDFEDPVVVVGKSDTFDIN